jgi:hypothetical protein
MRLTLLILAILPAYQLSWHPVPRATSYVLERQATLDPAIWRNDTLCSAAYPCSTRTYSPVAGTVEQWKVRAVNMAGSTPSDNAWTMLTLDWSAGNLNPSTYEGNGAMDGTLVKVMLPSPHWTVVYSYQGAIPVWVKATCDFDFNNDGCVNLIDLYYFGCGYGTKYNLSDFASFGEMYQRISKRNWRAI